MAKHDLKNDPREIDEILNHKEVKLDIMNQVSAGLAFGDLIRIKINKYSEKKDSEDCIRIVAIENQFAEKVVGITEQSKDLFLKQ